MDRKDKMPHWVYFGLLNIYSKKGALILFWSCLVFALLCIPGSYYFNDYKVEGMDWSWAGMMFAVSLWYWLCINWVDNKSTWD